MGDRVDEMAFEALAYATADKTAVDLLGDVPRVTKDDVHNMLMVAGFTPGLGNVADAADAVLYAVEGEFGAAGLSAAAMIPFIGQAVSAKRALKIAKESGEEMITMYRGVDQWHPGKMVEEGKFIGGGHHVDPRIKKSAWVAENREYAEGIAGVEGGMLLEFDIPESYLKKHFTINKISPVQKKNWFDPELETLLKTRRTKALSGIFHEGIPKEFLTKVHKAGIDF